MSRTTRRKHILREMAADNFELPHEHQRIVKMSKRMGNNLHEVEPAEGASFLVSMPKKFRRTIWIKRGNFVLIDPIAEGKKVKGEIVKMLSSEHIRVFTEKGAWPKKFTIKQEAKEELVVDGLVMNTNRPWIVEDESVEEEMVDDETSDTETA